MNASLFSECVRTPVQRLEVVGDVVRELRRIVLLLEEVGATDGARKLSALLVSLSVWSPAVRQAPLPVNAPPDVYAPWRIKFSELCALSSTVPSSAAVECVMCRRPMRRPRRFLGSPSEATCLSCLDRMAQRGRFDCRTCGDSRPFHEVDVEHARSVFPQCVRCADE